MLVYIIDEDTSSRRAVGTAVQRLGYGVKYFSSGVAFIQECDLEPGCVLLDMSTPGESGVDVLSTLHDRHSTMPVVIIIGLNDVGMVVRAMKLGLIDVLVKPLELSALATAIQQSEAALAHESWQNHVARRAEHRLECLTRRERDVLAGLAKGLTNKTIGYDLGISSRTVEIHRAHLMAKLDVHSFPELLRIVYDSELSTTESKAKVEVRRRTNFTRFQEDGFTN